jgi:ribosomal protein S6
MQNNIDTAKKVKRGRPKLAYEIKKNSTTMHIRVSHDLHDRIYNAAVSQYTTTAVIIRNALEKYLSEMALTK